jgi:hypothetical protein
VSAKFVALEGSIDRREHESSVREIIEALWRGGGGSSFSHLMVGNGDGLSAAALDLRLTNRVSTACQSRHDPKAGIFSQAVAREETSPVDLSAAARFSVEALLTLNKKPVIPRTFKQPFAT